jgi:Carboxypeptidase regulatory-like domain/TonB dependent receptor
MKESVLAFGKAAGETLSAAVLLSMAVLAPASVFAQAERNATLLVTVVDETRGVLPGATVVLTGIDQSTKSETIQPVTATDKGLATFSQLLPGRYSIRAEFSGFQPRLLPDVRIRSGENKQVLVLPIDRLQSSVTVERDRQNAAADRDVTFGTVLTREQIDALSDDPEELRRQLIDMAGPDAKILIDSFEGRDLPPKAMIKSIRITRDQFAPEVHFAGELRIEILTQPGIGPVRGNMRMGFFDSAMDGRHPLVNQRGPAQSLMYGIGLNGTLINERASFHMNFSGQDSYSTPPQYAATSSGLIKGNAPLRSPADSHFYSGGFDYALTRDQVLRVNFNGSKFSRRNMGVGTFDLIERAYSSEDSNFGFFLQQNGPIGRRFVLNTRLSVFGSDSVAQSAVEAPAIVVNDAFTSGGAQRRGGTHGRNYYFNSDLDYVRGLHSIRSGIEVQYARFRTDSESNYLGTYVFESLEAFEAGRPRSYTRRVGDPNVTYSNVQAGLYIQDDFKVRKGLTLTGGVRYEAQSHIPDALNFAPRAGFTWAPFKHGKTTLRGSWGVFYDWLSTGIYSQTLQIDGLRQREVNILNPVFPDPGTVVGTSPPTNRYLLADDRVMAYSQRLSAGIAQTMSRRLTANVLYTYAYRYSLLAGRNLNAPVNGIRPDPAFSNVIVASQDGEGNAHNLHASFNLNLAPMASAGTPAGPGMGAPPPPPPPGAMIMMMGGGPAPGGAASSGRWFSWRRGLSISGSYGWGRNYDNTDGAFSIPASVNLAAEWGPSAFDRRHNGHFSLTSTAVRNLSTRLFLSGSSAAPLTIRTGIDDNGDLVFNDRPVGVGRNSARTLPQWNSSASFTYVFTLGKKQVTSGGGVQIMGSPAGFTVNPTAAQTIPRYRLNLTVNIQNLMNRPVYSGFSGIMTSPFFLKPTSAFGVRRVTFNTNISF